MNKKILLTIIFTFTLCFSVSVFADEASDIESAYDYYSNIQANNISGVQPEMVTPKSRFSTREPEQTESTPAGLGGVAASLMSPVAVVSGFLSSMAIIIGLTCLFASFVRYMQHRVNPLAHPIGTVVTLLVLGIILVLLPLIYKLIESGVSFSLG